MIAELLEQEQPSDIYAAIVSSQFDADRLDYLRRDKMMTGTEQGGFDWAWLLHNLESDKVTIGGDGDEDPFQIEVFIIGSKGLQAAESYLLGRFHLYTQVYMHKTTRAAEKMFAALLSRVASLIREGAVEATGLAADHPLVRFIQNGCKRLEDYLELDDAVAWASLPALAGSQISVISELARRLQLRRLYKCLDVGALADLASGDARADFRRRLVQAKAAGDFPGDIDVLEDRQTVSPYKFHDYESKGALEKIMIRRPGSQHHEDVARLSRVVDALKERRVFRVYARDEGVMTSLKKLWEESK